MTNKCTAGSVVLALAVVSFGMTVESHGESHSAVPQRGTGDSLMLVYGRWFAVGAAIPGSELNQAERQLLCKNFGTVTPENCMKPAPVHPAEDRFDFAKADALVEMARAAGLTVNGHTLLWHQQWGLHDGRSWLNQWPSKRTNHPLLWDRSLQPKPAFSAVLALAQEPGQNVQPKPAGATLKPAP